MKYYKTAVAFTGQKQTIERKGDMIWDCLCDGLGQDQWTIADATAVVQRELGYAPRTARQYVKAVIKNVQLETGESVIKQRGKLFVWVNPQPQWGEFA